MNGCRPTRRIGGDSRVENVAGVERAKAPLRSCEYVSVDQRLAGSTPCVAGIRRAVEVAGRCVCWHSAVGKGRDKPGSQAAADFLLLVSSRAGGSCQSRAASLRGDSRGWSWHWGLWFSNDHHVPDAILSLSRPRCASTSSVGMGTRKDLVDASTQCPASEEYHFASPGATSSATPSHQRLHFAAYPKMQRRPGI
ncbi:hypothetical protein PAHAL_9G162100 [Panicum hallii]|uniref:Uncharacterized protein n=1 Tax=Panicum hallii TaxID=206008 RepID=A0A2T8I1J5_9POAL|nr:hypothetical protein PAHAL_9G162100 [Panicum hallii]